MPHLWLRVAAILYAIGTLYALLALWRRREIVGKYVAPIAAAGALFHLVSVLETSLAEVEFAPTLAKQAESILALVLVAFFLFVYWRYKTASHALFVFPIATLLTLSAAVGQRPPNFASPLLRSGWVYTHIALIFIGYAALLFSFFSSVAQTWSSRTPVVSTILPLRMNVGVPGNSGY